MNAGCHITSLAELIRLMRKLSKLRLFCYLNFTPELSSNSVGGGKAPIAKKKKKKEEEVLVPVFRLQGAMFVDNGATRKA